MDAFKNWAISQGSVATPIGTYVGECVSLVQQYLDRVFGIPFQARGHAKDWPTNGNVLANFDKVSSPQAGDIGVSGATATNPYGHIWIYLSPTQILEQNGRVARRVSVGSAYSNPIAILRKKGTGGNMADKTNLGTARILAERILGRDFDATHQGAGDYDLNQNHVNRDLSNDYIYSLWTSPEANAYSNFKKASTAFYKKYADLVGDLEKRPTKEQLEAVQKQLAEEAEKVKQAEQKLAEEQAKRSEDTELLDGAGTWLSKLFNRLFKKG